MSVIFRILLIKILDTSFLKFVNKILPFIYTKLHEQTALLQVT